MTKHSSAMVVSLFVPLFLFSSLFKYLFDIWSEVFNILETKKKKIVCLISVNLMMKIILSNNAK